jgi:hypothetical protein
MNLLSFDIEIADVFDLQPGESMEMYAPFHISVAATAMLGGEERLWYSLGSDERPAMTLTRERAVELLAYLEMMQDAGTMLCAWNGLGFDLKWIGHQAGDMPRAARVALRIYDPMFQFFNQRGFPVGLAAVGAGMGIEQTKLMSGADAPKQWQAGNFDSVMEYVLGDCQMTNQIVRAIQEAGEVRWRNRKGAANSEPMPRLYTVEEIIGHPAPDQSWMSRPIPKASFYQWAWDALER